MLALIPAPAEIELLPGRCRLAAGCRIVGDPAAANLLRPWLAQAMAHAPASGVLAWHLRLDVGEHPALGDEGYRLHLHEGATELVAAGSAGLRHGISAIRQLLHAHGWDLPALRIRDRPRFAWRGVMLDVARHLFPVETVLRLIDLAAAHRLNVFHWHLSDDQGWRIEIPGYPRLTEVGAWRAQTIRGHAERSTEFDGRRYGGFYTTADVRRVVAHAAALGITVVPEIDLPGHMQAAIAAYPELGNQAGPVEVGTRWGVSTRILNADPATFAAVERILDHVLDCFPSPWIHLGGDEVPVDEWRTSPAALARCAKLGLADPSELQHTYTAHFATWLRARGRRLVGWDEIHERSGERLPADAVVMAWRDPRHGVAAARAGHRVVMAPGHPTYLDHYHVPPERHHEEPLAIGGCTTVADCAAWEPLPAALAGDPAAELVLGGQAQLWTEYMPDQATLDGMAFPRLCGIAEALWSTPAARARTPFAPRLDRHLRFLDRLGVAYRRARPGEA